MEIQPTADDAVDRFEVALVHFPTVELPLKHYFADGLYAREMTIPPGAGLTGKVHKTEHIAVISKGDITVWSEEFGTKRIKAPCTFVSAPGTRRAAIAHEETIWTTFHATRETDIDKLEAELVEERANPLLPQGDPRCPLLQ